MKKTLIAIAAVAATGAMAQSSVSISGYFDRGILMTDSTDNAKDATTLGSNAGTTSIVFQAKEDLGKGMSMALFSETNPADLGGIIQDNTNPTATSAQTSGFNNGQSYIELAGGFGSLKLGQPNSEMLGYATGIAQPAFSTAVGSSFSSGWSIHNGMGTASTGYTGIVSNVAASATGAGVRSVRIANTIKYSSPSLGGLQIHAAFAPQNSNSSSATNTTVGMTELSARYTKGPLDVGYSTVNFSVGTADTTITNGGLTTGASSNAQLLAASYAITPAVKIHGGYGNSSSSGLSTNVSTVSNQLGVSFAANSAVDLMAQYATVDDQASTNYDRRMMGLGLDYKLSKNTRAYLRYESLNLNTNAASSGSEQTKTAAGISIKF